MKRISVEEEEAVLAVLRREPSKDEKGRFLKGHRYSMATEFQKGIHPLTEIKKGQHLSPKTEFQKGITSGPHFVRRHIPWNKGIPCSQETKDKISAKKKGISNPAHSIRMKGRASHNKGKKASFETREKMSLAKKGKSTWNRGIPWSSEQREHLSIAHKGQIPWWKKRGLPQVLPLKSDTKPERTFVEICKKHGLPFKQTSNGSLWLGRVNPDFVNETNRLAIFIDGCYWHGCPVHFPEVIVNKKRDERAMVELKDRGWTAIRIWEHEVLDPCREEELIRRLSIQ